MSALWVGKMTGRSQADSTDVFESWYQGCLTHSVFLSASTLLLPAKPPEAGPVPAHSWHPICVCLTNTD